MIGPIILPTFATADPGGSGGTGPHELDGTNLRIDSAADRGEKGTDKQDDFHATFLSLEQEPETTAETDATLISGAAAEAEPDETILAEEGPRPPNRAETSPVQPATGSGATSPQIDTFGGPQLLQGQRLPDLLAGTQPAAPETLVTPRVQVRSAGGALNTVTPPAPDTQIATAPATALANTSPTAATSQYTSRQGQEGPVRAQNANAQSDRQPQTAGRDSTAARPQPVVQAVTPLTQATTIAAAVLAQQASLTPVSTPLPEQAAAKISASIAPMPTPASTGIAAPTAPNPVAGGQSSTVSLLTTPTQTAAQPIPPAPPQTAPQPNTSPGEGRRGRPAEAPEQRGTPRGQTPDLTTARSIPAGLSTGPMLGASPVGADVESNQRMWEGMDGPNLHTSGPTATTGSGVSAPTTPAQISQMAAQLLQIAQNTALHRREILLNPQELGRIKLNLTTTENSVHVTIMIERPETLDLLRRHIHDLGHEFRQMGYSDVGFTFQDQTGAEAALNPSPPAPTDDDDGNETPPVATDATATLPFAGPRPQAAGQLDLRV